MQRDDVKKNRRQVLKSTAAAGLMLSGSLLAGAMAGCEKDSTKSADNTYEFDVSSENVLSVEGGAVMKTLGEVNAGKPVIIIRSGEKSFVVLSSVCTHQGCQVSLPVSPGSDIICGCHDSHFSSADGSVKQGPATDPLPRFASSFDSGKNILTIRY